MKYIIDLPVILQIADFGMARNLQDSDYYTSHGGQIPVKWTAPEVGLVLLTRSALYNLPTYEFQCAC